MVYYVYCVQEMSPHVAPCCGIHNIELSESSDVFAYIFRNAEGHGGSYDRLIQYILIFDVRILSMKNFDFSNSLNLFF